MDRHASDVMVALTLRVPRGQQGFWATIRDLHRTQGEWTIADVDLRSNVRRDAIGDFIRRLAKGGYIELVREDPAAHGKIGVWRLVRDQPEAPQLRRDGSPAARVGRGQDQMWRSMKMLARFSARELALAASTEGCHVALETAKSYIKHLHRAGYLKPLDQGIWRLKPNMNTGPLAPQIQRTDWVFDPNLKKGFSPDRAA